LRELWAQELGDKPPATLGRDVLALAIAYARQERLLSVTQQFNTTTSMGRLALNVLLSFAQFEREVAGERIRDKFAASRRKGMWMGGTIPLMT
jgi:site-specific DNA recombinase